MSHKVKANRLIDESSPYLQQHAYNPVDWYPWNQEALEKSFREDKPILVSIGYSSCHWCHVMERESFENEEIASRMNEQFVCIKIDREERPDLDQIYMEAVQAMGLNGGWPLNVFLTPNQKPFYGGTYFPPRNWYSLLGNISEAYKKNKDQLLDSAEKFAEHLAMSDLQKYDLKEIEGIPGQEVLDNAFAKLESRFDLKWGGIEKAPKFPMPSNWLFLLRYFHLTENENALQQALRTMHEMAAGGIYDQVGGGFARYSVDAQWLVPHFEKMLYDNGQLLTLYAEGYLLSRDERFREVLEETSMFLSREMLSPEGGLYSALDADSEGEEGKFYVWQYDELENILTDQFPLVSAFYRVSREGNWEEGKNILHYRMDATHFAEIHNLDSSQLKEILQNSKNKMLAARYKRVRPGLDDKIIAGWNGLALKGLAEAAIASDAQEIEKLAVKNALFLEKEMIRQGEIFRLFKSGSGTGKVKGFLDDYAFVIEGFLAVYQLTFEEKWLQLALELTEKSIRLFYDEKETLFFYTPAGGESLIARKKEIFDNVIPASNSAMAYNLFILGRIFERSEFEEISRKMIGRIAKLLNSDPYYLSNWLNGIAMHQQDLAEVAITGNEAKTFARQIQQHYHPFRFIFASEKPSNLPLLRNREPIENKTTIFVCYQKSCQLPVFNVDDALAQLIHGNGS
jgi:uncharacterized protein YyaL (SSP411 family)